MAGCCCCCEKVVNIKIDNHGYFRSLEGLARLLIIVSTQKEKKRNREDINY